MTSIPQPATDYLARLVDPRKKAYAESCLACWQQGQPFASEWPNLKAEYVQDVAAKMRRYLGVKSVHVAEQTTKPAVIKPARAPKMPTCKLCGKPSTDSRANLRGNHHSCVEASVERQLAARERSGKGVRAVVPASKPDVEQAAKAVALPSKVVQFKVRKLTKYGRSQDAIDATLSGGNQYYAGLITETIGGMPWADALTMYQSIEWQERNHAALTQARAYGLLAERTATYTEAAG